MIFIKKLGNIPKTNEVLYKMNELEQSRKEINDIDEQMAHLFERRMNVCARIAGYKKEHGLSVRDPAREEDLINKNKSLIEDAELEPYYVRFLRNNIDVSCEYQSKAIEGIKVSYCGTEGAFSQLAAKRMFPEAELAAFREFAGAYNAVESGECDCAVLPLENSYAGEVGTVMDMVFSGDLYINQVIDVPIIHDLVACEGATEDTIKTVVSHPQALQQCETYLREHGYETKTYSNTALAAEYVKKQNDPTIAAIASEDTAQTFGLNIVAKEINDSKNNTTRFGSFSRARNVPSVSGKRENENFLLMFTVRNEAGSLAGALNIIGAHGFNMRSLRSRPMKDLQWNYYFYIEAEGNVNTVNGKEMMQELSAVCAKLRLVGSYYANNVK